MKGLCRSEEEGVGGGSWNPILSPVAVGKKKLNRLLRILCAMGSSIESLLVVLRIRVEIERIR